MPPTRCVPAARRVAPCPLTGARAQNLEIRFTAGPSVADNQYHVPIVRGPLTRNIAFLVADVRDEIVHAFNDEIPLTDGTRPVSYLPGDVPTPF